ncbi:hypothetical protein [Cystobacter ferrugineus]|uniref:Uncharacterized protein n=1 Tax=Cystobacter ferrugineus TaxID=83449 RepID=A0A1L9B7H9_9BACT|nr:hypothetical protein [Cystobacter ferrugineus]OJH38214.1 hypothetical protein BON30_24005 [Cystobacter ferrugineus]
MRSRVHTAGPLIAPLLVVLWVIQSVLALAHFQEHSHRYCAVHGSFEEASSSGGAARWVRFQEERAVERQPAASEGALRHEACDFLASSERPQWTGSPPPATSLVATCLEVNPPVTESPRALSSLSVLDLAPKVSPPARA